MYETFKPVTFVWFIAGCCFKPFMVPIEETYEGTLGAYKTRFIKDGSRWKQCPHCKAKLLKEGK